MVPQNSFNLGFLGSVATVTPAAKAGAAGSTVAGGSKKRSCKKFIVDPLTPNSITEKVDLLCGKRIGI